MRKFTLLVLVTVLFACSQGDYKPKGATYEVEGVALAGYDPVAYFEQSDAVLGNENEAVEYNGLQYYFASTKNRKLFEEDPEKYLPAYGGWCAYAVAETSTKMEPDPTKWQIQNGELQLFYSDWMTNLTGSLKDAWNETPEEYKVKADSNWEKMK